MNKILEKLYAIHKKKLETQAQSDTSLSSQSNNVQEVSALGYVCPYCGSTPIRDVESGLLVCPKCGTVLEDRPLEQKHEWRAFNFEEYLERARAGSYMHDFEEKLRYLHYYDPRTHRKMVTEVLTEDRYGKIVYKVFREITRICSMLKLPDNVQNEAKRIASQLIRKVLDDIDDSMRTYTYVGMATGCVYYACLRYNIFVPYKDILEVSGADKLKVFNTLRAINEKLGLKIPLLEVRTLIYNTGLRLNLPREVIDIAIKLYEKLYDICKREITGKKPQSITALCLLLASKLYGIDLSVDDLVKILKITKVIVKIRMDGVMACLEKKKLKLEDLVKEHANKRDEGTN